MKAYLKWTQSAILILSLTVPRLGFAEEKLNISIESIDLEQVSNQLDLAYEQLRIEQIYKEYLIWAIEQQQKVNRSLGFDKHLLVAIPIAILAALSAAHAGRALLRNNRVPVMQFTARQELNWNYNFRVSDWIDGRLNSGKGLSVRVLENLVKEWSKVIEPDKIITVPSIVNSSFFQFPEKLSEQEWLKLFANKIESERWGAANFAARYGKKISRKSKFLHMQHMVPTFRTFLRIAPDSISGAATITYVPKFARAWKAINVVGGVLMAIGFTSNSVIVAIPNDVEAYKQALLKDIESLDQSIGAL